MREEFKKVAPYVLEYYHITDTDSFVIEEVNAADLFTESRFDLSAKLYYIKSKAEGGPMELADKLYRRHIEAFQDGVVKEAGNYEKTGIQSYKKSFDELIEAFLTNHFDPDRFYIPADKNGQILDGAHRAACAIYFGKKIKIIRFLNVKGIRFDAGYFSRRCLEKSYLRIMASVYPYYRKDTYVLLLWPKALKSGKYRKALKYLKNQPIHFIYRERIQTDYEQFLNLIYHCYRKEKWLGDEKNHYKGVRRKANSCFTTKKQAFEIYIIQNTDCQALTNIKMEIRKILQLNKRGIHTTDNKEESSAILEYIFQLDKVEEKQHITLNKKEQILLQSIRKIRNIYTRLLIFIKKILRLPV